MKAHLAVFIAIVWLAVMALIVRFFMVLNQVDLDLVDDIDAVDESACGDELIGGQPEGWNGDGR